MEHEEIPQLSFDDLLTNDDSSEKAFEQIIRSNQAHTKPLILQKDAQLKKMNLNPATGKPIFIHNLAQTIKTTQNGNQIISRVIKNDNGTTIQSTSMSNAPIQMRTTATNSANQKIIVLPAGKGQPVRMTGTTPGNIQLVRSANNVLTLKGQVVKVVSNASPSTSTVTTTTTQKGIPPGAIIIKSVNQAQRPQTSGMPLKPVVAQRNIVKLAPNVKASSSFQIKSVTTSSGKQISEVANPTKYTIVRNANGQQIKIIPHSQAVLKTEVSFMLFI